MLNKLALLHIFATQILQSQNHDKTDFAIVESPPLAVTDHTVERILPPCHPVEMFFDATKNVKTKTYGSTADVSWMLGGMFSKSEKLKTECLKEGNVFDERSKLLHHQIPKYLSVLRMDLPPCPSKSFSVEYTFLDNLTKPKATFFLPPKEFCETQISVEPETESKENPISEPSPTTSTTEYSMSRGGETATVKDLEVTDITVETTTTTDTTTTTTDTRPTTNKQSDALETTTVTLETSTNQSAETEEAYLESTINSRESAKIEMSNQMIAKDKTENDKKMGSQHSNNDEGLVMSVYLLEIGTGVGVIIGLLLLLLGIVAKKRRSTRVGLVVMREGVDENPLYGQLRESDIVEMRDVNTYYAGPLDDDTDDSD